MKSLFLLVQVHRTRDRLKVFPLKQDRMEQGLEMGGRWQEEIGFLIDHS
jgi:hypothetical protein